MQFDECRSQESTKANINSLKGRNLFVKLIQCTRFHGIIAMIGMTMVIRCIGKKKNYSDRILMNKLKEAHRLRLPIRMQIQ